MQLVSFADLVESELVGDDPLPAAGDDDAEWMRAEALRKSGQCQEAAPLFFAAWEHSRTANAGWRYAYCLRKADQPEAALRAIFRVAQVHPDHSAVQNEKTWCIYEARLKPAVARNSAGSALGYAREMLLSSGGQDSLCLRLLVFALVRVARARVHWEFVADACGRLDPGSISSAPRRTEERQLLSDRERFYYAHLKALAELARWDDSAELAERALRDFPRNQDYVRSLCRAWYELGDSQAALGRLEETCWQTKARWYLRVDLARLQLEHGQLDPAWESAREAAQGPAEDTHKVVLWELMAAIAMGRQNETAAADHLGLALALRRAQGWSVSPDMLALEERLSELLRPLAGRSVNQWKAAAREHWRGPESQATGAPRRQGILCEIQPGRAYCFIRCDKEQIYTQVRDIPVSLRHDGTTVSFVPVPNFDPKKQKESLRASDIQAARASDDFERF